MLNPPPTGPSSSGSPATGPASSGSPATGPTPPDSPATGPIVTSPTDQNLANFPPTWPASSGSPATGPIVTDPTDQNLANSPPTWPSSSGPHVTGPLFTSPNDRALATFINSAFLPSDCSGIGLIPFATLPPFSLDWSLNYLMGQARLRLAMCYTMQRYLRATIDITARSDLIAPILNEAVTSRLGLFEVMSLDGLRTLRNLDIGQLVAGRFTLRELAARDSRRMTWRDCALRQDHLRIMQHTYEIIDQFEVYD